MRDRRDTESDRSHQNGVDDGTRTHDGRNHNPGLYQLSYVHHRPIRSAPCPRGWRAAGLRLRPSMAGAPSGPTFGRSKLLPATLVEPVLVLRCAPVARPAGLEPATPGLEGRCSIQLSYGRKPPEPVYLPTPDRSTIGLRTRRHIHRFSHGRGRGRGIRTPDPLLPKQMRYQTAPCPASSTVQRRRRAYPHGRRMIRVGSGSVNLAQALRARPTGERDDWTTGQT